MSAETPAYNPLFMKGWVALAVAHAVGFFCLLVFGDTLLSIGHVVWSLLRWLASPII
jgi:hypothetical protein